MKPPSLGKLECWKTELARVVDAFQKADLYTRADATITDRKADGVTDKDGAFVQLDKDSFPRHRQHSGVIALMKHTSTNDSAKTSHHRPAEVSR